MITFIVAAPPTQPHHQRRCILHPLGTAGSLTGPVQLLYVAIHAVQLDRELPSRQGEALCYEQRTAVPENRFRLYILVLHVVPLLVQLVRLLRRARHPTGSRNAHHQAKRWRRRLFSPEGCEGVNLPWK